MSSARAASLALLALAALLVSGCASTEPSARQEEPLSLIVSDELKSQLDLMVLVKTSPHRNASARNLPAAFRRNIDGELVLAREEDARETIKYDNCYLGDWSVNRDTTAIFEVYEEHQKPLLQVNKLYGVNGIDKPAAAAYDYLKRYFDSQNRNIRITRFCEDDQPFETPEVHDRQSVEIVVAPRFLYKILLSFFSQQHRDIEFDVLRTITFDEIHQTSAALVSEENKLATAYEELSNRYTRLAEKDEQLSIGALVVGANTQELSFEPDDTYNQGDGFYSQRVCALEREGIDQFAVFGYRNLNGEMLAPLLAKRYQDYTDNTGKELRFELEEDEPFLHRQFKTLDDAYRTLVSYDHDNVWQVSRADCHVFVGLPANLAKLRRALSEQGVESDFGRLMPADELREQWVVDNGFESLDEYAFAASFEKLSWGQLKVLRDRDLNTPEAFQALEDEIVQSGYGRAEDLSAALAIQYLQDRDRGAETGVDALTVREQRAAQEKQKQQAAKERRQKRQKQRARQFPYQAVLACEFQGNHTNLVACFTGGKYDAETTLELTNGDQYRLYKFYDIDTLGTRTSRGVTIDLRDSFAIKAQNSSADLLLTLTIRKRSSGEVVFQKSAAQYGVISVGN